LDDVGEIRKKYKVCRFLIHRRHVRRRFGNNSYARILTIATSDPPATATPTSICLSAGASLNIKAS
jgi:hypothetical protein